MSAQVESAVYSHPQPVATVGSSSLDLTYDDIRSLKPRVENLLRRNFGIFELRDKVTRYARDGLHLNIKVDVGTEHIHLRLHKLNRIGEASQSPLDNFIKHIKVGQAPETPLDQINDILE